jgi:hypothetical protein
MVCVPILAASLTGFTADDCKTNAEEHGVSIEKLGEKQPAEQHDTVHSLPSKYTHDSEPETNNYATNALLRKTITPSYDEDIISMIQQLNETMYTGYLENITSIGPRVTGTPACDQAGRYIYNEFKNMGLEVRYHNWSWNEYYGSNIEATLKGLNTTSDEIYIICAHYDTVPQSPGADDNGAGTAAVLSAANVMSQHSFNYTFRFVTFSGEEQWMLGSYFYVEEAYRNNDNIIATLNLDMIGYAENKEQAGKIRVFDIPTSSWITNFTHIIAERYYEYIGLEVVPSGYQDSDNTRFWEFNYDAIYYEEYQFNPYYHTSEDTIENINTNYATRVSKLAMATLAELAQTVHNLPPDTPAITGPTDGRAREKYEYTFSTVDPDGHDVYYYIDWDDDQLEEWIGPYASGEEVTVGHTFPRQGIYTISVKAKDIYGMESNWATLEVNMPKNKTSINPLLRESSSGSLSYGVRRVLSLGNKIHSLIFFISRSSIIARSIPKPKPPWGGIPYLKAFR